MFEQVTLLEILGKGGVAGWILLGCSVLVVAISIERGYIFWRASRRPQQLLLRLQDCLRYGDVMEAVGFCSMDRSLMAAIFKACLLKYGEGKAVLEAAAAEASQEQLRRAGAHLWILGTIGAVAPFIGLFGTVIGIMRAFSSIAQTGSGGMHVVAGGIAEALIATAAGLGVAIIAVVMYNFFVTRIKYLETTLKEQAQRFIDYLIQLKGKEECKSSV